MPEVYRDWNYIPFASVDVPRDRLATRQVVAIRTIGVAVTSLPSKQMWPVQIWYGALKTHQQLFFCIGCPSSVGATPTHRNMRWSLNSRSAVISASCFMPPWWNGRHSRLTQVARAKQGHHLCLRPKSAVRMDVPVQVRPAAFSKIGATNPYNRAGTWTKRRLDRVQRNGRAVVKWSSRNSLFYVLVTELAYVPRSKRGFCGSDSHRGYFNI